jgi:hypothetical protein
MGGTKDKGSQLLRDCRQNIERGEQANWSGRLRVCTGLQLGQETTCQGLDLRLVEEEAPLTPLEAATPQEKENHSGVDGKEPCKDLQGPPAIVRMATAPQQAVGGARKSRASGGSGFQQALDKLKGCLNNNVIIKQELGWQCNVKTDCAKQAVFKDKAQTLQTFSMFLVMRPQSGYLTCVHLAHVYHSSVAIPLQNGGKFIEFIGDPTPTRVPIPIKLPLLATFE